MRKDAAHASSVRFGYDWSPGLTDLPEDSVVRIHSLFYAYVRNDNNDIERIRMLELRVPGTYDPALRSESRMRMEYDAFMHMRDLNHNLIDISQYRITQAD